MHGNCVPCDLSTCQGGRVNFRCTNAVCMMSKNPTKDTAVKGLLSQPRIICWLLRRQRTCVDEHEDSSHHQKGSASRIDGGDDVGLFCGFEAAFVPSSRFHFAASFPILLLAACRRKFGDKQTVWVCEQRATVGVVHSRFPSLEKIAGPRHHVSMLQQHRQAVQKYIHYHSLLCSLCLEKHPSRVSFC